MTNPHAQKYLTDLREAKDPKLEGVELAVFKKWKAALEERIKLAQQHDYLVEKLREAKTRIVELDAVGKEHAATLIEAAEAAGRIESVALTLEKLREATGAKSIEVVPMPPPEGETNPDEEAA